MLTIRRISTRTPRKCRLRVSSYASRYFSSTREGDGDDDDDDDDDQTDDFPDNDDRLSLNKESSSSAGAGAGTAAAPWKTLLELPARAAWRVTKKLHDDNDDSSTSPSTTMTSNHKSMKSIYQTRIVPKLHELASAREADRRRAVAGKPAPAEQQQQRSAVLYGRQETWAAAHFRWAANGAVTRRVLEEARALTQMENPRRILDFGMGCGSATAAALEVFGGENNTTDKNTTTVEWIHGIDPSATMREAAEHFLDLSPEKQRLTFSSYLSAETAGRGFDLALCCYTLQEIPYGTAALAAAALLWEKLEPNGVLVFIEPGTPDGFASIRSVRNLLLAAEEQNCRIVAPCTHQGPCPMQRFPTLQQPKKKNDGDDDDDELETKKGFCSFVQSLPPQKGRTKKEKFSYLVVQKRVVSDNESPSRLTQLLKETQQSAQKLHADRSVVLEKGDASHRELLQAAEELEDTYVEWDNTDDLGLELVREDPASFGRILHAPRKKKGHVLMECCAAPGHVTRYKISKSHSRFVPGIYAAARKSRWGGFWPAVKELEG